MISCKVRDEIIYPFLNFENEYVTPYHNFLYMWLIIHVGIKVN